MKKKFWIYIAVSFIGAWALQILASTVLVRYFQIVLAVSMYVPLIAVLAACGGLGRARSGIGWKIGFKRNWKKLLLAWFLPMALTAAGAALYFAVFPGRYDTDLSFLAQSLEAAGVQVTDGTIQGLPLKIYVLISCVQAISYAPLVNCLFAVGEEAGWRGFMTPALVGHFGRKKGIIIAGIIWGLWHAPVIAAAGYEYGKGYFGAPVTGILTFCVFTTALGIVLSWLYDRTDSIWIPAVFHGAINAAAGIPLILTDAGSEGRLLGPAPNGLVAGIPLILLALILFLRADRSTWQEDLSQA